MSNLLLELVKRLSPTTHEEAAVAYLVGWMSEHGYHAHRDDAGNAVGMRGDPDAPKTLLMLGHIDTYPGNLPAHIDGDLLYGRGSVDAKGPLCAFAEAAASARLPADWRVIVVGAVEEESATSKGANHILATLPEPTMVIIGEPSSAGRITLGYKGRIIFDYTVTRSITHTAGIEASITERGVDFWNAVKRWADAFNEGKLRAFDRILTYLRSVNTSTDHITETCVVTISLRLPPDLTPTQALEQIAPFCQDGSFVAYGAERTYVGGKNNALVRAFLASIRAEGMTPSFVVKTGTSDMNVVGTEWTCPMVAYGPGDSALDHTPHEHISLTEYATAIRVLRRLIEGLN
jgi:[amino group carrier protein]-lysine/ornithine hydrolase